MSKEVRIPLDEINQIKKILFVQNNRLKQELWISFKTRCSHTPKNNMKQKIWGNKNKIFIETVTFVHNRKYILYWAVWNKSWILDVLMWRLRGDNFHRKWIWTEPLIITNNSYKTVNVKFHEMTWKNISTGKLSSQVS